MRKSLLLLLAGILALPAFAQSPSDISIPEFRQALIDFANSMDSAQGPDFARTVQGLPDATLVKWYQGVPNGRQFQSAVGHFRAARDAGRLVSGRTGITGVTSSGPRGLASARQNRKPLAATFSPAAGIDTVVAPDIALQLPEYPSGANWTNMTNTLSGVSALESGPANMALCLADNDATMSVLVSTFRGIKDAAEAVCNIVPDPVVIILGEGTAIPAKEICFAAVLIIGGFNSAVAGYFADCEGQTGLIVDAENGTTNANLIALHNLEFRLALEENLENSVNQMGMFDVPLLSGGYLEYARAVVKDTITKMGALGYSTVSPLSFLSTGDTYYNAKSYKQAYKMYQAAYQAAVK